MNTLAADPRPQRALRLAFGVALGTALGFGLALPLPFLTPMLVLVLLVSSNQPLSAKAGLSLALVVTLTCGSGLLLSPLLVVFAAPIIAFVDAAAVQVHDLALYRQLLTGGAQ